jgi:hypothetical protein
MIDHDFYINCCVNPADKFGLATAVRGTQRRRSTGAPRPSTWQAYLP